MSTNEESMLTFIDKLLNDETTPIKLYQILFNEAIEADHAKVVQKILLSGLIDSYLSKCSAEAILMESFDHLKQYKIAKLFLLNQDYPVYKLSQTHLVNLLNWACFDGKIEIVKLLLDKTDPSAKGSYSFREAVGKGHIEIVKLLLDDKRVDPRANNNEAICLAFDNGHIEVVKLLIPLVDMSKIYKLGIQKIKEEMQIKSDDYEEAKILIKMILKDRSRNSDMSYDIGKYLFSVDDRLLTEWIEFNEYYSKEKCEQYWTNFKFYAKIEFAIGSLRSLALQDSPAKYIKYQYEKGLKETL